MTSLFRFAVVVFALAAPSLLPPYAVTLCDYIGVYALAAIGLTLLTGVGGIVSFGQAAFVGVAAYATAWATTTQGWSPWAGLGLAMAASLILALLIGATTMRLKGHLLSLSTLASGLAIFFLFGNIEGLGRFTGIADIPPIAIGQTSFAANDRIYYPILFFVTLALAGTSRLLDSRVGRAIRALRGGALLVESFGASLYRIRIVAFVWAAGLASLSGWLYAHLSRFVSPTPFDASQGIEYLMMAMVGGAATPAGGLIGAGVVALMKNAIQDYLPRFTHGAVGQLEIVVFSGLFILLLQRAREGLTPAFADLAAYLSPPAETPRDVSASDSLAAEPTPREARYLKTRPQREPGPHRPTLLRFSEVTRRFKGLLAVNNLSFEVGRYEIVGLIGPNGAGKSTTFNLLTGALGPSAGRIFFDGKRIEGRTPFDIARRGIARTFQHVKLRPRMSVIDNVLIGAYGRLGAGVLRGALRLNLREETAARREALRWLARVGLAERASDPAGQLSLGEQRLVEVARALMADPILLALDEPAAGLRRPEKRALAQLLKRLRSEGLTILVVEHDMEFVMNLVDRLVVMDFGQLIGEGTPEQVRADARVREAYLGGLA